MSETAVAQHPIQHCSALGINGTIPRILDTGCPKYLVGRLNHFHELIFHHNRLKLSKFWATESSFGILRSLKAYIVFHSSHNLGGYAGAYNFN